MNNELKVLVACEESQTVCIAYRNRGYEAFSCDIQDCSGGHPEWHFKEDVFNVINREHWDLMVAHPPCTYLTVTGNKWFKPEFADRFPTRLKDREDAIVFFRRLADAPIEKIAIENPVGIMSTRWRKPDQYIQPYQFGDYERKKTGLWLKNLPSLTPTNIVEPKLYTYKDGRTDGMWHYETMHLSPEERTRIRSKTFQGIANAMAEQWHPKG